MKRCLATVPTLAALLVLMIAVAPVSALDEADRLFMVGERALADRFYPVARRALERAAGHRVEAVGQRALANQEQTVGLVERRHGGHCDHQDQERSEAETIARRRFM